jgi:translocation and assembly module TamB
VDLRADWRLRLPDRPVLTGHTRLEGALQASLELTHNMAPPLPLRIEGRIEAPLATPRWQLTAGAEGVDLAALGADLPPVSGGFRLEAEGGTAEARGRLTLQGRHPEVGPFHAGADWSADLTGPALHIAEARAAAGDLPGQVSARGDLALTATGPRLDLTGDWRGLRWPLSGEARWRSAAGSWSLAGTPSDLTATVSGGLNETGEVDAAVSYRPDALAATLRWSGLRWPDPALPLRSDTGSLSVTGQPADYRFRLAADLAHAAGPEGRLEAAGGGDLDGLTLEDLRADLMTGRIDGSGELAWRPQPRADLHLTAAGLDPGTWFARWPGALSGDLRVRARLSRGGPEVTLDELRLDGRLRERDVRLRAAGGYRPGRLDVEELTLAAAETRLGLTGHAGDTLDLAWRLTSPELGALHPDAGGRLSGEGRITGEPRRPRVVAELQGSGLAFVTHRVDGLALDADIDLSGRRESRLRLEAADATVAGSDVARLRLTGSGRPDGHALELDIRSPLGDMDAEIRGAWQARAHHWAFELRQARLSAARLPEVWRLQAPVAGTAGPEHLDVAEACLTAGEPRVCLAGAWQPGSASGRFRAKAVPLGYLLPLLPAGSGLEGRLGGSGAFNWQSGEPVTGRAELVTTAGRLVRVSEDDAPVPLTTFRQSRVTLTARPEAFEATAELNLGQTDRLRADLRLQRGAGPLGEAPVAGTLRGQITDLAFLPVFVPEITAIGGRIEVDLSLAGRLREPALDGRLRLEAGELGLQTPGITLRELVLTAEPTATGNLALSGRVRSGEGSLQLAGSARLAPGERWLEARLWGEDFLAMDTARSRVWLSPDLSLSLQGRGLALNGEVRVPRADIRIRELPAEGAVKVSSDQVIVRRHDEGVQEALPFRVTSRVRLVLGKRVEFEGFGLTSRFTGDMTVVDEPGRPTTASGEIRTVEGEYRAYGQRLSIETGKLLFGGGPITDPGLDVRAVRRPRSDILVGVHAHGRLREPRFEVFSEPAMPQAEQLSWLVLGRPLDEASGGEQAALSRAAVMLGVKGGALLAETIGTDLGLDEVSVETQPGTTGDQAAVVLGKYLSPNLYVSYGIGLFEAVNTVRMQYTLTEHWRLVTESSAIQTGGDLFYTIETGGR